MWPSQGAKANVLPVHQLTAQTLPSSNIAQGSVVPQHLPVHPYSPPNLPLSHFTNMISYPFLPQSYPYLPYAAGSSAFHQSPAAVASAAGLKYPVPQFKSSISGNSLPQAGSIASGYGGSFGNAASVSNFNNMNASNSVSSTLGYDDMLSHQFKEGNHYVSLQQVINYYSRTLFWQSGGKLTRFLFRSCRMRDPTLGFMALIQEQCQLIHQPHTTVSRIRISPLVFDKGNSHHLMEIWGTQTFTLLSQA